MVTALANAHMDSTPIVAITGQVASTHIGTDAFQEAPITEISAAVTKHNFLITNVADVETALDAAFVLAAAGRPGPVLVDITKDALAATLPDQLEELDHLASLVPLFASADVADQCAAALDVIVAATRPVLYIGGGVVRAGAEDVLEQLVEYTSIPVVTTLTALGALPGDHRYNLGMPGMHGTVAAVAALQAADVVVAVGARFDDRVTGTGGGFAPGAKIVHIDVDDAEIGKNHPVDVPVLADAAVALQSLLDQVRHRGLDQSRLVPWWEKVRRWQETFPLGFDVPSDGSLGPQQVIFALGQAAPPDTIFTTGVGQHQMWAAQFLPHRKTHTWITSAGLGTMGFAVPAAIGAKLGRPDRPVWAVDGDGSFQMTSQELATAVLAQVPIKIAIVNNGVLGMVRQWQSLFYGSRFSATTLNSHVPDFAALARSYGAVGLRAQTVDEMHEVIAQANAVDDAVVVVDFRVHPDAMVWPMVPAGVSNSDIAIARSLAPVWAEDD